MSLKPSSDQTLDLLRTLVHALDEKKAESLRVLRVTAQSSITDYLVLATGTSDPHLRALRIETERVFDAAKQPIAGVDTGGYAAGWMVFDAYQIMVHLFTAEQRENYALEMLWKDAEDVDLTAKEKPAKKTVKKAVVKKKTTAKKTAVVKKGTVKAKRGAKK